MCNLSLKSTPQREITMGSIFSSGQAEKEEAKKVEAKKEETKVY